MNLLVGVIVTGNCFSVDLHDNKLGVCLSFHLQSCNLFILVTSYFFG
jgi:hypothetical protein